MADFLYLCAHINETIHPMNTLTPVTKNLLIINILFYLAALVLQRYGVVLNDFLALYFFKAEQFKLYQLVSYMFLHADIAHLFFNMFALFMFGPAIERICGMKLFLIFYMVCGIGAGIVQEVTQYVYYSLTLSAYDMVNIGTEVIPMTEYLGYMRTVGASGAIYGLLLAFGMFYPNAQLFIFPFPFPIKAKYYVVGLCVIELLLGLTMNDSVAHTAHVGGMFFGWLLIMYWKRNLKRCYPV